MFQGEFDPRARCSYRLSSRFGLVGLADLTKDREDLASNVSHEASNDLSFGHPLLDTASHVAYRPLVIAKPDQHDSMESRVGLAVTTTVEPVPVRLAGRSGNRTYSTEGGEGCLGLEALWIVASGNHQARSSIGSNSESLDQGRCCHQDELAQF